MPDALNDLVKAWRELCETIAQANGMTVPEVSELLARIAVSHSCLLTDRFGLVPVTPEVADALGDRRHPPGEDYGRLIYVESPPERLLHH